MYTGDVESTNSEYHSAHFLATYEYGPIPQDDMSRTEDLTTKLRTLSYDHERMTSMHKSETERASNAEREMNLHKSRML